MESKLKFKDVRGSQIEIIVDLSMPIVLEVASVDSASTVIVKDPSGITSTQEWVGGMKKR